MFGNILFNIILMFGNILFSLQPLINVNLGKICSVY